jgi:hypothetical protein
MAEKSLLKLHIPAADEINSFRLDVIYEYLENLLKEKNYEEIDSFFEKSNPAETNLDESLAYLIITKKFASYTPNRSLFLNKLREYLDEMNENTKKLLYGLT